MDISLYTNGLIETNGIFHSGKKSEVSYPESGNDDCFEIEENSFWFIHRNRCIVESVKKFSSKDVFFDVGGGNGYVAKGLEDSGFTAVLLEPGLRGCINAKKRNLKNIVCGTTQDVELKLESIPSIGLFDVVEHIEDDVSFLKEIFAYLETGGRLFLTVPAYTALWSNDDSYAGHYRRYNLKDIKTKLESIGFKMEYTTYIFSILPLPVFIFRTMPSRFGFYKKDPDIRKYKNEHMKRDGVIDWLVSKVWNYEINRIKQGRTIMFGGSCLVVAKK